MPSPEASKSSLPEVLKKSLELDEYSPASKRPMMLICTRNWLRKKSRHNRIAQQNHRKNTRSLKRFKKIKKKSKKSLINIFMLTVLFRRPTTTTLIYDPLHLKTPLFKPTPFKGASIYLRTPIRPHLRSPSSFIKPSLNSHIEFSGNRKKFKRCIYKELKMYERQHPETVKPECTVKGTYYWDKGRF